jgi:hypothetical protein
MTRGGCAGGRSKRGEYDGARRESTTPLLPVCQRDGQPQSCKAKLNGVLNATAPRIAYIPWLSNSLGQATTPPSAIPFTPAAASIQRPTYIFPQYSRSASTRTYSHSDVSHERPNDADTRSNWADWVRPVSDLGDGNERASFTGCFRLSCPHNDKSRHYPRSFDDGQARE